MCLHSNHICVHKNNKYKLKKMVLDATRSILVRERTVVSRKCLYAFLAYPGGVLQLQIEIVTASNG